MYKLFRWFNRNRKILLIVILGIAFLFIILQLLNNDAKKKQEESLKNNINENKNQNYLSQSAVTGQKIEDVVYKYDKDIINDFTKYCNLGEVDSAYNLLSQDCKDTLYENIEKFRNNYYNNIFVNKKECIVQYWAGSIYEVKFIDDMLSTGKSSNQQNSLRDYMRIVTEEGERKLSINGYFGKVEVNKERTNKNVTIKILNKQIYMDYEIYNIQIKNNTDDIIILDNLNQNNTMYLEDNNGTKHYAITNEIVKNNLIVKGKHTGNVSIKFDNPYIKDRKINSIHFSNIGIDYDEENGSKNFKDILNVKIEI